MHELGVTSAQIQQVIRAAPKAMRVTSEYATKVAAVAPKAVPVIRDVLPFLPLGPALAPLVQAVSEDAAKILKKAPTFADPLKQAMNIIAKAPEAVAEISAVTGPMADVVQRIGEDPALDVFVNRLMTIIDIYKAKYNSDAIKPASASVSLKSLLSVSSSASQLPSGSLRDAAPEEKGVGLKYVVPWLDRGIYVANNKWLMYAMPAALIILVGAAGYGLGRISKR